MKINRLEAHDRLLEFGKQADYISQGCVDCINSRPPQFGNHCFYIFCHKRTIELDERYDMFRKDWSESILDPNYVKKYTYLADVPTARNIWIPRLDKPTPQENSMLFKAYPPSDTIKVVWIIPDRELWQQYTPEKMTQSNVVSESIHDFQHNRNKLEAPESDDWTEDEMKDIARQIGLQKSREMGFSRIL